MADYIKGTDFALKDSLPSGDSAKIVKGTEIDAELNAIESSVFTKADRDGLNLIDGSIATAKIADGAVTTAKLASTIAPVVTSINNGQLAGMRNKIINGKMEIAQRGTSFAAATDGSYSLDRWKFDNASASVFTISQQADAPSSNEFQNSLRLAVTTADSSVAAGDLTTVQQVIEGYNARDLIGKTFTLSFFVRSAKTGVHCVAFRNNGSDRSYVAEYTINSANTWEQKVVTVAGGLITTGNWNWVNGVGVQIRFVLAAGSTFQTTAGAWQTGNFLATTNQVNCLDTVGNIFAITGVQLEVGSVATPFEHRPYGAELALCQRYRRQTSAAATGSVAGAHGGVFNASNGIMAPWRFDSMRTTPTITIWNNGVQNQVRNTSTGSIIAIGTPTSFGGANTNGFSFIVPSGTPAAAGTYVDFDVVADSEL